MTDQTFDSQLFHEVHEPLHRSRGFDPHSHRAWKLGIKLPHVVAFVLQSHAHYFPRFGVQHCHYLLRACKSHPIILISASFGPSTVRANTEQFTRAVARPASLWHQPNPSRRDSSWITRKPTARSMRLMDLENSARQNQSHSRTRGLGAHEQVAGSSSRKLYLRQDCHEIV